MRSRKRGDAPRKQQPKHQQAPSMDVRSDSCDIKSTSSVAPSIVANFTGPGVSKSGGPESFSNSHTWVSDSAKLQGEFARLQRLVRHVAPEQFKNPAKPTHGPCGIVPTTLCEYVTHNAEVLRIKTEQMQLNLDAKKEAVRVQNIKRKGEIQPPIKSRFGVGAKVYSNGLSPVLCQPTMWSAEYGLLEFEEAEWPTQTELQDCGDKRENKQNATRCGRYLPQPRLSGAFISPEPPHQLLKPPLALRPVKRLLPFDEHGPIFRQGPSPVEILHANKEMDDDPVLEALAQIWLGNGLMQVVGEKKPPFVPDWLARQRQEGSSAQARRTAGEHDTRTVPSNNFAAWFDITR